MTWGADDARPDPDDLPPPWTGGYAGSHGGSIPQPGQGPAQARTFGVGELLAASWMIIRHRLRLLLSVVGALGAVSAAVQGVAFAIAPDASTLVPTTAGTDTVTSLIGTSPAAVTANLLGLAASFVIQVVATGLFAILVGSAMSGYDLTGRSAWRRVRPRFWALLCLTIVTFGALFVVAAVMVGTVVSTLGTGPLGEFIALIVGLGSIATMVFLAVSLVLAPPTMVLEGTTVLGAWRRSFALARGARWRLLGIWILAQLIAIIAALIVTIPVSVLGAFMAAAGAGWPGELLSVVLTQFVTACVVLPYVSVAVTLMYVDRRIRTEGIAPTFT